MEPTTLSLDEAREHFYVAQRACERFSGLLKQIVETLEQKKVDDAWLELVQDEATKAVYFHSQQGESWSAFAARTEEYLASVQKLGEQLAIAEIKGQDASAEVSSTWRQHMGAACFGRTSLRSLHGAMPFDGVLGMHSSSTAAPSGSSCRNCANNKHQAYACVQTFRQALVHMVRAHI